jgi:hypothetical protein
MNVKVVCFICLICSSLSTYSSPSHGWEFTMKGEIATRTRYVSRTGPYDIFGAMDADTVNLGVNHIKNWPTPAPSNRHNDVRGVLAGEPGFGSDAVLTEFRSTLFPKLQVNKAIWAEGSVNLTSVGVHSGGRPYDNAPSGTVPTNSGGFHNTLWVPINVKMPGTNVPNTMVTVQWWRLSVRFPMFDFSVGMKPYTFGTGLIYNRGQNSASSMAFTAHYGPWTIGQGFYHGRTGSGWNVFARDSLSPLNFWRKDSEIDYLGTVNFMLFYNSGPLSIGFSLDSWRGLAYTGNYGSRNPDGTPGARPVGRNPIPDLVEYDVYLAVKYSDGKYFFNGEAVRFWNDRSGRGVANDLGTQVRQNQDMLAWTYGVETGVVTGPAKFSLSYVRSTGDDPSTRETSEEGWDGEPVSAYYMRPWAYLMYWTYGTGMSFGPGGHGQISNFHHVGCRLDYAVATNLNLFGVWSHAWRDQPGAYRLGGNYLHTQQRFTNDDLLAAQLGQDVRPVPQYADRIGWEADIGFQWKLLEGFTWKLTLAYWQPGNWWSHAYPNTAAIYRNTPANAIPNPNPALARMNPDRKIDPLLGLESVLLVEF